MFFNKNKNKDTLDEAVADPARVYGSPANVLNDAKLSHEEKRIILESWALDQKRLMESEDENMGQVQGGRPSASALYQEILAVSRKIAA